ncbi:MAG: hypothetical protein K6G15_11320 [Desulfovibrio sp.]|nr:hypothetical protein [Desulfovibrio sp.]
MNYEALLMGVLNQKLTKQVNQAVQAVDREDRSMPNSTRRAFESRMKGDAAVARMASQNMEDGKAMVNVAQTNATAIKSQLQAIQEILTDCAYTDSLSSTILSSASDSIGEHIDEILRLANNASFNGMKLMDGSAGNNGTVDLQAGSSVRAQKFMNLLDSSLTSGVMGSSSMNLNNLSQELAFTDQAGAKAALANVEQYIERMQGLESQYSYDYKSLDNLSLLFEEQADIYDQARERSSASPASGSPSTSKSSILSQLLSSSSNSIISGST